MTEAQQAIVAIAVTRAGTGVARGLRGALPGVSIAVPLRFATPEDEPYTTGVRTVVEQHFLTGSSLVLVMAVGVAVRLVAPLLADKRTDPAVVVVDDGGRFAVSLLSGHLGGANRLAECVAAALGATAVITTASEAAGLPALDLLGRDWGWRIDPAGGLTAVTASLLNGDPIGVLQQCGRRDWLPDPLPENITVYPTLAALIGARPAAAIVISDQAEPALPARLRRIIYRPPTLALGAGTSRDAPSAELHGLALRALAARNFAPACVGAVATIDRRREEPAVVALAAWLDAPLLTFSAARLDAAPGSWSPSAVVQGAVGTRGVCEPAALLAAGCAELAVPKQKSAHATVAIARNAAGLPYVRGAVVPRASAAAPVSEAHG